MKPYNPFGAPAVSFSAPKTPAKDSENTPPPQTATALPPQPPPPAAENPPKKPRTLPSFHSRPMPPVAPSTMGADDRTNAKDVLISQAAANPPPLASSATPYSLQSFALPTRAGRVIVFDTETTGFGMDDAIVEIAAIEIVDGMPTGVQFHAFVNPGSRSSNAFALKVHGLAPAFLARQPSAAHVLPAFFRFVAGAPLVAHNAAFDYRMLWVECDRHRLEAPSPRSVYCTQREHQRIFPNQACSLSDVARRMALHVGSREEHARHDALGDAKLAAELLQRLWEHKSSA